MKPGFDEKKQEKNPSNNRLCALGIRFPFSILEVEGKKKAGVIICFQEENLRDDLFKFPTKSTIENNFIFKWEQVRKSEWLREIQLDSISFSRYFSVISILIVSLI